MLFDSAEALDAEKNKKNKVKPLFTIIPIENY
jgi:hypothetical protein